MGLVIYRPFYQLCNCLCPVVPIAIEGFEMHRYMQEKAGETKGGKTAVVFQQRSGPQSQKDSLLLKVPACFIRMHASDLHAMPITSPSMHASRRVSRSPRCPACPRVCWQ